jgi:hypothetical protein
MNNTCGIEGHGAGLSALHFQALGYPALRPAGVWPVGARFAYGPSALRRLAGRGTVRVWAFGPPAFGQRKPEFRKNPDFVTQWNILERS